ncbi:Sphingomyelin phosphodiesterase [Entamoeba marina]
MLLLLWLSFVVVNTKKVWVITDTHYDDEYVTGAPSRCHSIDCCHSNSRPITGTETELSGYCGDYNCYPPLDLIETGIDYISTQREESDVVLWLMDVVPGDVVTQSKEKNKKRIQSMNEIIKRKLQGFRVYPIPGNHDYYISNWWKYPPDSQWMLDFLADEWSWWLPPNALKTVRKGGYYSDLLDDGLRLIALHLGYVDVFNVHSNDYPEKDPGGLFEWFNLTLKLAKTNNEHVLIISHECVGLKEKGTVDVNPQFNEDFNNLLIEYHDIIVGHICGHSHYDSFRLFPSINNPLYANVVVPAMTTWYHINPRFRLLEYNTSTIVDWTSFILDLNECNEEKKYTWKSEYSFLKEYPFVASASPTSLLTLYERLRSDDQVWKIFMSHYKDSSYLDCDDDCKKGVLCAMGHLRESEYQQCLTTES